MRKRRVSDAEKNCIAEDRVVEYLGTDRAEHRSRRTQPSGCSNNGKRNGPR